MKSKEFKKQLDELKLATLALNDQIEAHLAKVKRMPQGIERWDAEEWIIRECHLEPERVRTRPSWSSRDWLKSAMNSKDAARRYRRDGDLPRAVACEDDARLAEERAAWMGQFTTAPHA